MKNPESEQGRERELRSSSKGEQLSLVAVADELHQIIRPDENIERYGAFLFPVATTPGLDDVRELTWDVQSGKNTGQATLTVTPTVRKTSYTVRSYDVFLAVLAIWSDRGQPDKAFKTSFSEIAKRMELSRKGQVLADIEKELERLFFTTVTWKLCYRDDSSDVESVENMRILDRYSFTKKKDRLDKDEHLFENEVILRINEQVQENQRSHRTIPVNWTTRKSIKSSQAKVIYNLIDSILAHKPSHQRTARNLLDILNNSSEKYEKKYNRKQFLTRIRDQLDGKRLSDVRFFLNVFVEETSDSEDFKLIFKKIRDKKVKSISKKGQQYRPPVVNEEDAYVKYLGERIGEVVGSYQENRSRYEQFGRYLSENLIERALGNFKESLRGQVRIENKGAYFQSILHRLAHEVGANWVEDCGAHCEQRAENQLPGI